MSTTPISDEAERRFLTLSENFGPADLIALLREMERKNHCFEEALVYIARDVFCFSLEKAQRVAETTLKTERAHRSGRIKQ